jgi:hypothetical protein
VCKGDGKGKGKGKRQQAKGKKARARVRASAGKRFTCEQGTRTAQNNKRTNLGNRKVQQVRQLKELGRAHQLQQRRRVTLDVDACNERLYITHAGKKNNSSA